MSVFVTETVVVWQQILSLLPPLDLSSAELACVFFADIVRRITTDRMSDITRGMERLPVRCFSKKPQGPRYPFFEYSRSSVPGSATFPSVAIRHLAEPWGTNRLDLRIHESENNEPCINCNCSQSEIRPSKRYKHNFVCNFVFCPCGVTSDGYQAYDESGRLLLLTSSQQLPASLFEGGSNSLDQDGSSFQDLGCIFECGSECECGSMCPNRVTQNGIKKMLQIEWNPLKGWGLHAAEDILSGTFICEYAGEILTDDEAKARQHVYDSQANQPNYLMVVREHLPDGRIVRTNIDPTWVGNVGRFMNHSCGGGNVAPVLIRNVGSPLPRVALFASSTVQAGEELTFAYGGLAGDSGSVHGSPKKDQRSCYCSAGNCKMFLPYDAV